MRKCILVLVLCASVGTSRGQEAMRTVTRRPSAADSLPNSSAVPEAASLPGNIRNVLIVRLKYDTDLLQGLENAVRQNKIRNAVILAGIGSVRNYRFHVVSSRVLPPNNTFVENPSGPADLASMNGYVIDGRIHAHLILANTDKAFGGHLETGTTVLTFAIVTLGILGDDVDLSRVDDTSYR